MAQIPVAALAQIWVAGNRARARPASSGRPETDRGDRRWRTPGQSALRSAKIEAAGAIAVTPLNAPDFAPRPSEFKVDAATGLVKDAVEGGRGVSVFDNAESVASKGFVPHEVLARARGAVWVDRFDL